MFLKNQWRGKLLMPKTRRHWKLCKIIFLYRTRLDIQSIVTCSTCNTTNRVTYAFQMIVNPMMNFHKEHILLVFLNVT